MSPGDHLSPSQRVEHFDGEVPPALSPLDAFAAQGRLLAKQFDESRKAGRRMSRIPPASVARSLSRPRPGYFRSASHDEPREFPRTPISPAFRDRNPEVEEPRFRPKSQHPRLSGVQRDYDGVGLKPWENLLGSRSGSEENIAGSPDDENSARNAIAGVQKLRSPGAGAKARRGPIQNSPSKSKPNTLAPPIYLPRSTSSPGGISLPESSDDDYYGYTSSAAGSTFSKPRKLSSSSGMSMPHSPMSNFTRAQPRSPSPALEQAGTPNILPRPSFNFSRPLSRSSTSVSLPSPLSPEMGPTGERQLQALTRENRPAPISVLNRAAEMEDLPPSGTYTYATFTLPRGRGVSRDSVIFSGLQTPHFEWQEPLFESPPPSVFREDIGRTPSPPPPPRQITQPTLKIQKAPSIKSSAAQELIQDVQAPAMPPRHSFDDVTQEVLTVKSPGNNNSSKLKAKTVDQDDAKSTSANSGSTIRPHTGHKRGNSNLSDTGPSQLTAEEHVAKGIECHENGSLKESTYYLRLAALQNHPTGMLMYALACRHGWGMRPNQQEGVEWLRKAVNSVADITQEPTTTTLKPTGKALIEQKARQAQFALSIYELGVSHLNGWGVDQDKTLARRCFEIAGQWGDADALAEAGYCYVEGIGCKKDLKKAAKYYRMAEAKGMSMVGNSWIYKDKYKSDDESVPRNKSVKSAAGSEKKSPRSKSRTRSIFGRKKSSAHDG
ncbi:hypothetical protein LOZ51_001754 [Ophidiomyces ophidiicola]|nr:hypothetical protein LOZ55_004248 [Ophidiomyces ophidiicola]KAI1991318.1 hypothetical protein LOZ54_002195 [Ophidiomyces ophidiicola]KAI1999267.1 hypothetical protein LOZ51_001754 [Ophidiomyces ophidiicola]